MQSTCAQLPQELVDMVVEYLRDDKPALRTCRFLSQHWLLAANARLFHTARLTDSKDFRRWAKLIRSSPAIGAHHLRHVEFAPFSRKDYPKTFPDLGCLPNVVNLKWSTNLRIGAKAKDVERFIASFPSLEEVSVSGGFASFSDVAKFLAFLPGVKVLRLDEVVYDVVNRAPSGIAFDASALETLQLGIADSPSLDWVANWMLPNSIPQNLRSFHVQADSMSREAIAQLIDSSAHSIEEFTIEPFPDPNMTRLLGPYVRQPLPNLRHIWFENIQESYNEDGTWPSLRWVTDFISHMPTTPTVTTIKFGFYVTENEESLDAVFKELDWEGIMGNFVLKTFPAVDTVAIFIVTELHLNDTDRSSLEAVSNSRFSKLGKRSLVTWDDGSCRTGMPNEIRLAQILALLVGD